MRASWRSVSAQSSTRNGSLNDHWRTAWRRCSPCLRIVAQRGEMGVEVSERIIRSVRQVGDETGQAHPTIGPLD